MIACRFTAVGVAMLLGLCAAARPATGANGAAKDDVASETSGWTPDDADLKRDLELLQGRWERITRNSEGRIAFQQEKVIEGNRETLTNRDGDGKVLAKHAVRFRLEKDGPVRIFSVYEMTIYRGEEASTSPTDFSYVYRVDDKLLLDAPGLFAKRPTYQQTPVIYKWQRAPQEETKKRNEASR